MIYSDDQTEIISRSFALDSSLNLGLWYKTSIYRSMGIFLTREFFVKTHFYWKLSVFRSFARISYFKKTIIFLRLVTQFFVHLSLLLISSEKSFLIVENRRWTVQDSGGRCNYVGSIPLYSRIVLSQLS